jgi:hypothetical protein
MSAAANASKRRDRPRLLPAWQDLPDRRGRRYDRQPLVRQAENSCCAAGEDTGAVAERPICLGLRAAFAVVARGKLERLRLVRRAVVLPMRSAGPQAPAPRATVAVRPVGDTQPLTPSGRALWANGVTHGARAKIFYLR